MRNMALGTQAVARLWYFLHNWKVGILIYRSYVAVAFLVERLIKGSTATMPAANSNMSFIVSVLKGAIKNCVWHCNC